MEVLFIDTWHILKEGMDLNHKKKRRDDKWPLECLSMLLLQRLAPSAKTSP
jgi:hypothetical protein